MVAKKGGMCPNLVILALSLTRKVVAHPYLTILLGLFPVEGEVLSRVVQSPVGGTGCFPGFCKIPRCDVGISRGISVLCSISISILGRILCLAFWSAFEFLVNLINLLLLTYVIVRR